MANKKAAAAANHTRIRNWFQAAWFAITNGYVRGYTSGKIFTGPTKALCVPGLNCYSCPGALAACPIGSLQAVLNSGGFKLSLYVFGCLSAFGVLFGRLVCAWMCPFGLFQDLLYKIKIGPKKKNLPGHKYLRWLRFVVLAVMVIALPALVMSDGGSGQPWFCEWICPSGTLLGGIPLVALNEEFQAIIGFRFAWKMAILVLCAVGAVVFYRPFCKYLCPLGAIYGLFNPVSTYRLEVDSDKCIKCRACQRACGMDIATFENPNSMDCIRCGDCVAACPKGAISSTWGKMVQSVKSRCFVDDEEVAKAAAAAATAGAAPATAGIVKPGTIRLIGILMLVGGIVGICTGCYFGLYHDFLYRLTIAKLENIGAASLFLGVAKLLAAAIVAFTGLHLLRDVNDVERSKSANEKIRIALILYLLGIVCFVVGFSLEANLPEFLAAGPQNANQEALADSLGQIGLLKDHIFYNNYCIICLPILKLLTFALKKQLDTGTSKALLNFALVLSTILTLFASAWGLLSIFSFIYG
ncbi:MAG: 4Fe-4S binding protein [Atopobiaceae bacterium]|nr:4Fe-4S binding protein [Atopobiaceae bacterium]